MYLLYFFHFLLSFLFYFVVAHFIFPRVRLLKVNRYTQERTIDWNGFLPEALSSLERRIIIFRSFTGQK